MSQAAGRPAKEYEYIVYIALELVESEMFETICMLFKM